MHTHTESHTHTVTCAHSHVHTHTHTHIGTLTPAHSVTHMHTHTENFPSVPALIGQTPGKPWHQPYPCRVGEPPLPAGPVGRALGRSPVDGARGGQAGSRAGRSECFLTVQIKMRPQSKCVCSLARAPHGAGNLYTCNSTLGWALAWLLSWFRLQPAGQL